MPWKTDEGEDELQAGVGVCAPGGPLFVPGFVSGLIRVRDLQHSWLTLLSALDSDFSDTSLEENDIDISVEDLRIVTDAQLVDDALAEVFQGTPALIETSEQQDTELLGESVAASPGETVADLLLPSEISTNELESEAHTQLLPVHDNPLTDGSRGEGLEVHTALEDIQQEESGGTSNQGEIIAVLVSASDKSTPQIGPREATHLLSASLPQSVANVTHPQGTEVDEERGHLPEGGLPELKGDQAAFEEGIGSGPGTREEVQDRESLRPKKSKKRGRPFDRTARAAKFALDAAAASREGTLAKIRQERDAAKANANLHSLRFKQEREAADREHKKQLRKLKFFTSTLKFPTIAAPQNEEMEAVKPTEAVLVVELYHSLRKHDKTQEFLLLGSQPLTALRDRIYCLTDELAEKSKLKVPSGYFLIEDVFYNDMRDPKAIDYSMPIIKWAHETQEATERWKLVGGSTDVRRVRGLPNAPADSSGLPTFRAASMADTCFLDLQFRIGAQYLYCHQGDCKHVLVIRDVRLTHGEDIQDITAYPLLKWHPRARHRKCSICAIYRARKVTYGDKLAPSSPCFFCEQCYYLLHYQKEGTLLYNDFQVFDYHHE